MFVLSCQEAGYHCGRGQREQQKASREELSKNQPTVVFLHQEHTSESSSICQKNPKKQKRNHQIHPNSDSDRYVQTLLSKHCDLGMAGWEFYSGLSAEVLRDWVEPASQRAERALAGTQSVMHVPLLVTGATEKLHEKITLSVHTLVFVLLEFHVFLKLYLISWVF